MPTMSDEYYPDPDALYEERNEWDDSWYDDSWYDDIHRDCDSCDLYTDEEEEEDDR